MPQAGKVFLESALELGYDCRKVNKYIYQDKCREECDGIHEIECGIACCSN